MSFILEHLFKGLASILLIYIAGHISYAFFRDKERSFDNEYLTEFIKLVLGTFVLTASYAVITTEMKTIFLGFFVIGLALFISDKSILNSWFRSIEKIKKINFKNLAFILLAFTPFYLWQVYNIYDYQSNNFYHTHPDFYFYAGLIDFFNTIGKEQNTINYFGADNTITLYHYGELWLSALFSKVFNTLPLFSFYLYTWSIFFLLTTVGALAILKAFEIPPAYITLLFITLPISFWYPKITIFQGLWLPSSFNYPKYLFVYIYVIFGILILHYRINIKYLSAVTGITVLFNTSIGPTIFLFHFLFLVYWWLQKQINIRALIGNMTFLLIPNCFIAFTFLINKSDKTYDLTLNWLFNSEYSYTYIEYVKTVLYLVRGVAVKTFFSMALAFVLIAISKNIKIFILSNIHVWIYLFMGVFVSFWVYGVFWIISPTDAVQFGIN